MIEYFEQLNEAGELVTKPRPAQYSQGDILAMIERHWITKQAQILDVIAQYIECQKWALFDVFKQACLDYDAEIERIQAEIDANSENPDYVVPELPVEPVFSWIHFEYGDIENLTPEQLLSLEPFKSAILEKEKQAGKPIAGKLASLTKDDQNGIGVVGVIAIIKALVEQDKIAVNSDIETMLNGLDSVDFYFQNGEVSPLSLDINQYLSFALPFALERQQILAKE